MHHGALALSLLLTMRCASDRSAPQVFTGLSAEEISSQLRSRPGIVLTFLGYSGAGYEDAAAMLAQARRVLQPLDRARTIVNIGATEEGIGAVYEVAKDLGFMTTGIVSTAAKAAGTKLSPHVDVVFFVDDTGWGGLIPGTERLSPTSEAMVAVSDRLVAIGGGEVSRAEAAAARRSGKPVEFIPADMNHRIARERAAAKGEPAPLDFSGAVAALFEDPATR